ncbi:MAG: DUF1611 domain-containing protein [Thermoguttaceae bacterium]|jgi:uncharacterized NAD-dependent epimerase/dehydratase family protein
MITARHLLILTDGFSDPHTAKTAICVIRYRPEDVVAVLDRAAAGKTADELFGVGGTIPVVGAVRDSPSADALLIGIAPPGGKLPPHWRPMILEAIGRGMAVISGLHEFLAEDPQFAAAAAQQGVALVDLRRNDEHDVAQRRGIRAACLRIHTVANDCSCGKMVAAVEVARGLGRAGVDAAFVATGQTGILVAGEGCPIDRVIADFVSGAAEKLVLANQHHEVMVVEGQGSLFHPRYSGVTLGLLHGIMPDGLIVCYEMGRRMIGGMEDVPLPPLEKVIEFYEAAANLMHPCRVIGVAVNGLQFSDREVADECRRVEREFPLPACDVIRHGPGKLVAAVRELLRTKGSHVPSPLAGEGSIS